MNLNDDPNIPIKPFTNPPDEEEEPPQGGKIVYRFRRRGEKNGKQKKS